MKNLILFALVCCCSFLYACEKSQDQQNYSYCQDALDIMARNSQELQEPYDWNRMMLASSRLVYINNSCGDQVTESRDKLCGDLEDAITVFSENKRVPPGANRDNALKIANSVFADSSCAASNP